MKNRFTNISIQFQVQIEDQWNHYNEFVFLRTSPGKKLTYDLNSFKYSSFSCCLGCSCPSMLCPPILPVSRTSLTPEVMLQTDTHHTLISETRPFITSLSCDNGEVSRVNYWFPHQDWVQYSARPEIFVPCFYPNHSQMTVQKLKWIEYWLSKMQVKSINWCALFS